MFVSLAVAAYPLLPTMQRTSIRELAMAQRAEGAKYRGIHDVAGAGSGDPWHACREGSLLARRGLHHLWSLATSELMLVQTSHPDAPTRVRKPWAEWGESAENALSLLARRGFAQLKVLTKALSKEANPWEPLAPQLKKADPWGLPATLQRPTTESPQKAWARVAAAPMPLKAAAMVLDCIRPPAQRCLCASGADVVLKDESSVAMLSSRMCRSGSFSGVRWSATSHRGTPGQLRGFAAPAAKVSLAQLPGRRGASVQTRSSAKAVGRHDDQSSLPSLEHALHPTAMAAVAAQATSLAQELGQLTKPLARSYYGAPGLRFMGADNRIPSRTKRVLETRR